MPLTPLTEGQVFSPSRPQTSQVAVTADPNPALPTTYQVVVATFFQDNTPAYLRMFTATAPAGSTRAAAAALIAAQLGDASILEVTSAGSVVTFQGPNAELMEVTVGAGLAVSTTVQALARRSKDRVVRKVRVLWAKDSAFKQRIFSEQGRAPGEQVQVVLGRDLESNEIREWKIPDDLQFVYTGWTPA